MYTCIQAIHRRSGPGSARAVFLCGFGEIIFGCGCVGFGFGVWVLVLLVVGCWFWGVVFGFVGVVGFGFVGFGVLVLVVLVLVLLVLGCWFWGVGFGFVGVVGFGCVFWFWGCWFCWFWGVYHGACTCSVRKIIPYTEVPVSLVRFSQ